MMVRLTLLSILFATPALAGDGQLPTAQARSLAGAIDAAFDAAYDGALASSPVVRCEDCAREIADFERYAKRCEAYLAPTTDALVMAMGASTSPRVSVAIFESLGGKSQAAMDTQTGEFHIEWSCRGSLRDTVFQRFGDDWKLTRP